MRGTCKCWRQSCRGRNRGLIGDIIFGWGGWLKSSGEGERGWGHVDATRGGVGEKYVYTCEHTLPTYAHTNTLFQWRLYSLTHAHTHTYVRTYHPHYVHTYMHTYINMQIRTYTHMHTHTHTTTTHTHARTYQHTHTHTYLAAHSLSCQSS